MPVPGEQGARPNRPVTLQPALRSFTLVVGRLTA